MFLNVILFLKADSHVLLTRSPLKITFPYDLHELSIPLAFILSQDQTLNNEIVKYFFFPVFICFSFLLKKVELYSFTNKSYYSQTILNMSREKKIKLKNVKVFLSELLNTLMI